jgi:ABC-2 type transport system ATP-binding protein
LRSQSYHDLEWDSVLRADRHEVAGAVAAVVVAERVGRDYGAVCAVSDLSFAAARGDVVGVLGRNGAGKTTSIRVLTTIVSPTRGSFAIAGVPHTRPDEIRRRIGVLPESGGYPSRQTGEEHLVYHARLRGASRPSARAAAKALLEEFGLGDRARTPLHAYSLGMRRRLGIARALVNDPAVVFLDEPTLGLDPAGRRTVIEHVRAVATGRGAAVLLSTHLLDDVEACCSRVLILHRGRTVAAGTVADVVRRAAAPRTAVVRVAPEDAWRAVAVLVAAGVGRAEQSGDRPGELRVDLGGSGAEPADPGAALRALLDAGIAPLGLDVEGARLSDAFLDMTGAA